MSHCLMKPKSRARLTFFTALAVAAALFLPFILMDQGYFIYYGDFNVQQIPFYKLAHEAVRSGDWGWSWTTDLGANFVGSYSFYLLGSPFFWLTMPFPTDWVPYLMGPLLVLKLACCALAAYAYLRRFVRPDFASIGGLLYAFSGFSLYNIFFNHFHEAILYFPLMLWAMEVFMAENRRGVFALFVCLSALNNYYFFIGQAIFLIIYWFVRRLSGGWGGSPAKLFWLAAEALLGTAGAAVLLLPSYLAVIQNSRTENLLSGWDFLIYSISQRFFDIIHSFFFPQDNPARPNFFPDANNKWASMSAWLPMVGCTGAIAYFQSRKHKDWLRKMLLICVVCALIPGLNAMFQLFNAMYYARWFYMMVLLLILATLLAFDRQEEHAVNWPRALGWSGGITAAFALFVGLMPNKTEDGEWTLGLMKNTERFWAVVLVAAAGLLLTGLAVWIRRRTPALFFRFCMAGVASVSLLVGWYTIGVGKFTSSISPDYVIQTGIEAPDFDLPETPSNMARVDTPYAMDNQAMFWGMPTIRAFHSIVPGSIMDFYDSIGINRSVGSRPETTHYPLRSFLSVRWLFDYDDKDGLYGKSKDDNFDKNGALDMPGWSFDSEQNGFAVYENDYYIPMGFTYEYYLTRSQFDELPRSRQEKSLLKALIVEDKDEAAVKGLLSPLPVEDTSFSENTYMQDCLERRHASVSSFKQTKDGFTAVRSSDEENVVFFSVPWEKGWSASVGGQPAEILRSGVGFMAVRCPAGTNISIDFTYTTPGLALGLQITAGAAALTAVYLLGFALWRRHKKRAA